MRSLLMKHPLFTILKIEDLYLTSFTIYLAVIFECHKHPVQYFQPYFVRKSNKKR